MSQLSSSPSVELMPGRLPSKSKQYKPVLPAVDHEASSKKLTLADVAAIDEDKTPPSATLSPRHSIPSQISEAETTVSRHMNMADDDIQRMPSESQKAVLEELGMSASLGPAGEDSSRDAKDAECSPEEMQDDEKSQGSSAHAAPDGDEAQNAITDAVLDDTAYQPAVGKQPPLVPGTVDVDIGDAGSVPSLAGQ